MNILFASSEAHPLIKTGGLADVSGSLPRAIRNAKQEIRLILPAYPAAVENAGVLKPVATLDLPAIDTTVTLLQGRLPGTRVTLYLVDAPTLFNRPGGPYSQKDGTDWPDNAQRFNVFCRAVIEIAKNRAGLAWQPDIVHCNDWQTGLIPALLGLETSRPATIFTIHNLAYQGLFSQAQFQTLGLPPDWWSMHKLEFHNQFSFIKGGLVYADRLTTVSPSYAQEICTPEYGCGLEGLLASRRDHLSGILNGVDYDVWNPGSDAQIQQTYTCRTLGRKLENKLALQKEFNLPTAPGMALLGHVGRLVDQKGIDLLIQIIPALAQRPVQLVILGTGLKKFETALERLASQYPDKLQVHIGYDEKLSHLLEAGSDIFLMPSRFEPCGLNQLYSLRYGTPPVVRRTGGLGDSVIHTSESTLQQKTASGFVFETAAADALLKTIDRALYYYAQPNVWKQIVQTGMQLDFSWKRSAKTYLALYREAAAGQDSPA
jgi:starch synthase